MKNVRKITVAIDIDDVLIDTLPTLIEVLNEELDTNLILSEIDTWEYFYDELNMTDDDLQYYMSMTIHRIPDKTGAVSFLNYLNQYPELFDYYLVSATYYMNMTRKAIRLEKIFKNLDLNKIIYIKDKSLLKADVLIDDHIKNLENFDGYKILVNMPHNLGFNDTTATMFRITDLTHAEILVHSIYNIVNEVD